jgi:hypothetical protein
MMDVVIENLVAGVAPQGYAAGRGRENTRERVITTCPWCSRWEVDGGGGPGEEMGLWCGVGSYSR